MGLRGYGRGTVMTRDEAFLQAILEDPEDDTPRLVYADWLEENGQPERGEFIRIQIELEPMAEDDPRRPDLQKRGQGLLNAHGRAWLEEVTAWGRKYALFRRGFVHEVRCTALQFLKG